jgi:acetyltransferase-like isoleucine patch superfamily enzyme
MIRPGVRPVSENHCFDRMDVTTESQGDVRGELVIEDDCWIGSGVTITSGVRIRRGTVVVAGSVVTEDTVKNAVVAGIPTRLMRIRGEHVAF